MALPHASPLSQAEAHLRRGRFRMLRGNCAETTCVVTAGMVRTRARPRQSRLWNLPCAENDLALEASRRSRLGSVQGSASCLGCRDT
jgi:hypothetical protein